MDGWKLEKNTLTHNISMEMLKKKEKKKKLFCVCPREG